MRRPAGDREEFYRRTLLPYKLDGYVRYSERRTFASDVLVLLRTAAAVVRPGMARPPSAEEIRAPRPGGA